MKIKEEFSEWLMKLAAHAIESQSVRPLYYAPFWRECFDDGMTPEQAFAESFAEQDGV